MTFTDLSAARLANQQVSVHSFKNASDLVAWMGACQAQDYNMAKWAIGIRLPAASDASVQKAIDEGQIIRTHVMRPTWHLVSARDASWMIDLTAPQIRSNVKSRHKELELTPAILRKSLKTLEKNLSRSKQLTRGDVLAVLKKDRIAVHDQRAAHILLWGELEKVICSGPMIGKKNTYALFDDRVKERTVLTRDEALMNLASRYFQSHGPATLQDFINWSFLPAADARKAIEFVRDDFHTATIGAQTYWFKGDMRSSGESGDVFLLPAFDEFIIGYKDRSASLPARHRATAISVNGIFWPVIVIRGTVTGLWKRTVAKGKVKVDLKFFPGQTVQKERKVKKGLEAACEKVKIFFGE